MGKGKEKVQWRNQFINLIAIIVGVYIAFYLTERNAAAADRKQANEYLTSMADDLASDIDDLSRSTDTLRYYVTVSKTLAKSVITQRIPYDSMNEMINSLYFIVPFVPKDNSYQSLLASGNLDLIDNFELRKKITELYHQHYKAIRIMDEINNQQRTVITTPYLMRNLRFRKTGLINAAELWQDNMFGNIAISMQYSTALKHQFNAKALEEARKLREMILTELEK